MNLWDNPDYDIKTPGYDSVEGYFMPSGVTVSGVYYPDGFSNVRAGKQLIGVDYYINGAKATDPRAVEKGLYNDARVLAYDNLNRLRRLTYLALGPVHLLDLVGENTTSINWRDFYSFPIQDFDGDTAFWVDPCATDASDFRTCLLQPTHPVVVGGWVSGGILFGGIMAEIIDAEYQNDLVYIHVDRPVNTDSTSVVFVHENAIYPFPVLPLDLPANEVTNPPRCAFDVDVHHNVFNSYKASYPGAWTCQGIATNRFCARINDPDTDLSKYAAARCNNTACVHYTPYKAGMETSEFISGFYLSKGTYLRQLQAGDPGNNNFRVGRDGWHGALQLIGGKVGCYINDCGIWQDYKDYLCQDGLISYRYGVNPDTGFDIFRTFDGQQNWLAASGLAQTDNTGILSYYSHQVTKIDPLDGGGLALRDSGTPGFFAQKALGVNRMQGVGFKENHKVPVGDGLAGKQTVRHRLYTSAAFPMASGTYDNPNGETRVTVYDPPQDLNGFTYNLTWDVPQFCDSVTSPRGRRGKSIANISSMTLYDESLEIEFELGYIDLDYTDSVSEPYEVQTQTIKCGGNVVKGDLAWEIFNPAAQRFIGDSQAGLHPGDRLRFTSGGLKDFTLICIGAKAYAGTEDPTAANINVHVGGVPAYVKANYKKRDVGLFKIDFNFDATYQALYDYIENPDETLTCIIDNGAITPPDTALNLYRVQGDVVTTLTNYQYDRVNGRFYINAPGWTGQNKLHGSVYVYDTRTTHPVENIVAQSRFLDSVVDHGWIDKGLVTNIYKAQFEIWSAKPGASGAVQIDWGLRQKASSVNWDDFSWDHADMELTIPSGQPAIGWSGWVISGYDPNVPIGFSYGPWFSSITLDIPENEQDYIDNFTGTRDSPLNCGFSSLLPVLKISSSLDLSRLINDDIAEAKLDFTLSDAEIKKINNVTYRPWNPGYPGEVLSSTNLNLVLLSANANEMDLANMDTLATIGCPVKRIQDGEHWKYQGTLDFTEHLKIVLDCLNQNKVLYIMPSSSKTEELTLGSLVDITNESITKFGNNYYGDDPDNLWWELIEMDMTAISTGGLHVRLDQSALTRGAKFCHDGGWHQFLPNLNYRPE